MTPFTTIFQYRWFLTSPEGGGIGGDCSIRRSHSQIRFDDLFRRFNGDRCSGLASVPKWFIIQACRAVTNQPDSASFNESVSVIALL